MKKFHRRISWKVLDRFRTADEIAAFLEKKKIKEDRASCPLEVATGWAVDYVSRHTDEVYQLLTTAEQEFVEKFDTGKYPELKRD